MTESIRVFENSLRDFLINIQTDAYNTQGKVEYKYNNLKVYMEPKKKSIPHFWVAVNISAACYQIDPVEKIDGSMGSDERYILKWAARPNINGELKKHWTYLTNSVELISQQVRNEKKTAENLEITQKEMQEITEIVTGTGVKKRFKGFDSNMRMNRHAKNIK